ncbi:MAG: UDP-N-acetylglucosamine 2-epimerase (non-hydrolyzing) [Bacteroidia bacterium]|nr:UDP-N-acetylglucosamine 2-epimerase (non-hydrolyzing) [Bacteroidia bacterium]
MKWMSVVGARPQFVKLAPLLKAIDRYNARQGSKVLEHLTIHTGQHYDKDMSDIFFEELEIPHADFNLGVGSGRHGRQTARMLEGIEELLIAHQPSVLIIFGDTNSTLAAAVAAAKLHIPIAHIEAGLRSFNRRMPEEINRIASDHISDLLLAPTPTAMDNLQHEGLGPKSVNTGDIMYDTVLHNSQLAAQKSNILQNLELTSGSYAVATVHRAENTDDVQRLRNLLEVFNEVAEGGLPIVFPIHPRTRHLLPTTLPDWSPSPNLKLITPVGYLDMLQLTAHARIAFTDSGGLQKEAMFLNTPCITLRDETEWVETVESGANIITGADPVKIREAYQHWHSLTASGAPDFTDITAPYFGQGDASDKIVEAILARLEMAPVTA